MTEEGEEGKPVGAVVVTERDITAGSPLSLVISGRTRSGERGMTFSDSRPDVPRAEGDGDTVPEALTSCEA